MWEDQGMKIVDTIINAEGKTVDLKKGIDDLNSSTKELDNDPTVAMRQAFADLKVALAPLLTIIAEVIGKVAEWAQANPGLSATIAAIGAAIGILVGAAMALAPLFMGIIAASTPLMASIAGIALPIAGVIAAIGLLIAAGVAIYKNWDEIKAYATSTWESIKEFLSTTWEGIKSTAETVWNGIKTFFSEWGLTLLAVFGGPVGQLVSFLATNWGTIKSTAETVWNGIKTFLSTLWSGIQSVAIAVWDGIKTYFTTVLNAYKTLFTTVWESIKTVVTTVWNGLKTTATTVWNGIKTFFTTTLNAIKTTFTTIWESIKSTITTVLNGIKSVVTSVWNSIKSTVTSVMEGIKSTITTVWNAAKSTVTTAVNGIKTVVSNVFNGLKSVVSTAMNNVKSAIETGWNKAQSFLEGIDLLQIGKDIVNGLVSGIGSMFGSVQAKVKELASLVPDWAKEKLGIHSPSRVMRDQVGIHIGSGLAAGIDASAGMVKKASINLAETASNVAEESLESTNVSVGLLNDLQELGPVAEEGISSLIETTASRLQEYVFLWSESIRLTKEQAMIGLEGIKIDAENKINELKTKTAEQLLGYQNEWRKAMLNVKAKVKNEFREMPSIGEQAVMGLIKGMLNKRGALIDAVQGLASIVTKTFQSALDIHSPSRVFKGFGININEGLIQGIRESAVNLNGVMNNVYGSMASSAGRLLQSNGTSMTNSSSTYDNSKVINNTININSGSRAEDIARANERVLRKLAFQFK